jgi:glutathione synthase/RimK-type ligase-like ATP-grasp enzyme
VTVALAISRDLPEMDQDEHLVADALVERGVETDIVVWDDDVDWAAYDAVVIRSTWDYWERLEEFRAWADRVGAVTRLLNGPDVVRWNTDKAYLLELEERGAPIVPTAWLGQGDRIDLAELLDDRGWRRAVLKPLIGAGASGLLVVDRDDIAAGQAHLEGLLAQGDAMVQPYLETIETHGETSLVYIDGSFSHAVRKTPAPGEHRIQIEFGGTYEAVEAAPDWVALGAWLVEATGHDLLYARVDVIPDAVGSPLLGELEATEPALMLAEAPGSAGRLADAILRRLAA